MAKRSNKPEDIVSKRCQIEVLYGQGMSMARNALEAFGALWP